MKGRCLRVSFLVISVTTFFLPLSVFAGPLPGTLPFGGLVSYSIPCTCSLGSLWIWFTPLWLGAPVPVTGSLVYVPFSSILYAWWMIGIPSTWHLGSYIPGVQACYMLVPTVPPSCVPWPAAGVITQVGTSKFF